MILRAVSVHQQMRSLGYEHHDARLAGPWDTAASRWPGHDEL